MEVEEATPMVEDGENGAVSDAPPTEAGDTMPPPESAPTGEAPGDEETATEGGENAEPVDFMAAIRKAKERAEQLKAEAADGKKRKREDDEDEQPTNVTQGIWTLVSSSINMEGQFVEEYFIPNNNMGRVIGKGGEHINKIQDQSKARVKIAQDTGGPFRSMTMTGEREQIDHLKALITQVVEEGSIRDHDSMGVQVGEGETLVYANMDIPSNRVGALIGRGGENITRLQADSGARLQLIQDESMGELKLLKMAGSEKAVAHAKELVQAILDERDAVINEGVLAIVTPAVPGTQAPLGAPGGPDDDQYRSQVREIPVPRWAVGSVIGRGGETIKRIQVDSGARVQFNNDNDNGADHRICTVAGTADMVRCAERIVMQIIQEAENRGEASGRGSTGGSGSGQGLGSAGTSVLPSPTSSFSSTVPSVGIEKGAGILPPPSMLPLPGGAGGSSHYGPSGSLPPPGSSHYGPPGGGAGARGGPEKRLPVSVTLCGLIIGRGGESIKEIQARSGAHVELDRNPPPNCTEKDFIIRGTPEQIAEAERLILGRLEENRERMAQKAGGGGGGGHPSQHYGSSAPRGLPPPQMFGAPPMGHRGPPMGGGGYGGPPMGYGGPPMGYGGPPMGGGYPPYGGAPPQYGGGHMGGMPPYGQPPPGAGYPPPGLGGDPYAAARGGAGPASNAAAPQGSATPASTAAATAGGAPAPGYPTDAEYRANIAWYNSQGYFGVPPGAAATPQAAAQASPAQQPQQQQQQKQQQSSGASVPGYPTDAEYRANIAWYNSQGYYGVPGQTGPSQ